MAAVPAAAETPPAAPPAPEPILVTTPELAFAARPIPVEPERPYPAVRRAIFFDVENTSRAEHIARVINHLAVDRRGQRTEFVAVGNWKVIGHDTARLLAHHGAQLVHSAPSTGVRDWSDLRIAVSAGVWLGTARPGDVIEIVSDDRAFDAVGDVASGLGVAFRRLSYRSLAGVASELPAAMETSASDTRGRRRRRGRRHGSRRDVPAPFTPAPPPAAPRPAVPEFQPAVPGGNGVEPEPAHTAPHDEIISVIRDLIERAASGSVSIDTLANTLKARGFRRTPGSPRLITRLRRIREVELSPTGAIRLSTDHAPSRSEAVDVVEPAEPVQAPAVQPGIEAVHDEEDERQPDVSPTGEPLGPVEAGAARGGRRRRGGRGRYRGPRRAHAAS